MLQMEERAPAPTVPFSVSSCTPHRRTARYHVRYDDFIEICEDEANGDAMRVFENKTNQRIGWLRRAYAIPDAQLPHRDDLWIEVSLRELEVWSLRAQSKSTYARCLLDQTREDEPSSLLELGYLRRRFVARPGGGPLLKPATVVYVDEHGEIFIVVDAYGNYVDEHGETHSAVSEGYTLISRQYLYCIETVNAAIAELDDAEPPGEMKRWQPVAVRPRREKRGAQAHETTKSTDASNAPQTDDSRQRTAVQGGTKNTAQRIASFDYQNNTDSAVTQTAQRSPRLLRSDPESLRTAQWTPETLIALTAQILDVPDPANCDEQTWQRDWLEPAQQIFGLPELQGIEPRYAWEKMERRILGMTELSSPSWWVQKRARATPITLRHVIGEKASNWRVVGAELDNASWYCAPRVPYDGPPILEEDKGYSGGYNGGIVSISEVHESPEPPPVQGMTPRVADRIANMIQTAHPTLSVGIRDDPLGSFVGIEYAEGCWYDFARASEWYGLSDEARGYIEAAARYGVQRRARPPGD